MAAGIILDLIINALYLVHLEEGAYARFGDATTLGNIKTLAPKQAYSESPSTAFGASVQKRSATCGSRSSELKEAVGKSEFRVVKKGKAAKQLMRHVVDKIGDGVDLSDEPVLRPLDNKTPKVLGTATSQAFRKADEALRSNHERT